MHSLTFALFAVHISDGALTNSWVAGGFVLAAVLIGGAVLVDRLRGWLHGSELREVEIAQLALLTAAFFVASQINVRVSPFTTAHLLLNGLLGVVLRWRAALAIPVGLLLQAALFGHGGFSTLGINSCVMVIPALAAWGLFAALHRLPWLTKPWFRGVLVWLSVVICILTLTFSLALIFNNNLSDLENLKTGPAIVITLHPLSIFLATAAGLVGVLVERRLENAPEFPLGLLIGIVSVELTVLLHAVVLWYGSAGQLQSFALITFLVHFPIALIEGVVLGSVVGFLARVKPELLGWQRRFQRNDKTLPPTT
jgi:cobalt/nickel transport system permease protein